MTKQEAARIGGRTSFEKKAGIFSDSVTEEQRAEWRRKGMEAILSKSPEELFELRSKAGKAAQARPGGSGFNRKAG